MFWAHPSYHTIEPYLDRDLLSWTPGRICRWDGTYKLASKLMDIPELDSIKVMLLIYGEYGDIVYFSLCETEGPQNWQMCHYFLMRRWSDMNAAQVPVCCG